MGIVEIFGLHVVYLASGFFAKIVKGYKKCKDLNMVFKILSNPNKVDNHTFISSLGEEFNKFFHTARFIPEYDLLYYRQQGSC